MLMLKSKKADFDAEMEQPPKQFGARNALVAELEALATKFRKQLEYCASQMRVAASKYLLLYETHSLK